MVTITDKKNKVVSMFDPKTGWYVRSGIIENGVDTGVDPFMTSYPQLIDVGIMGSCDSGKEGFCTRAGIQCYQNGSDRFMPNMTLDNFKKIVDESKGKTFQIALGGRGNPNKHESFADIIKYCSTNDIVPNYTTSGLNLSHEEAYLTKKYCGAVAVSWQRGEHTIRAIDTFLTAGVKTNIHFVLGNFSIDEAIDSLGGTCGFPEGVNAVIFLAHKPVGLGKDDNVLRVDDSRVQRFFKLIDKMDFPFKIGFDSCTVPGILNFTKNIDKRSIDTCEAARWSMYITADMVALPCSFDQQWQWAVAMTDYIGIQDAWNSDTFDSFRNNFLRSCPSCSDVLECRGGCPTKSQIVLCDRKERRM